jgi:hypothetical protein
MIPTNFTKIEENFWEVHPDMKITTPFKQLYANDTSKKKLDSSNMMWFIALCYDKESKYVRLQAEGEDGKHILIGEDFLNDMSYYYTNQEVLDRLITAYINLQYTATQRQLLEIDQILDKRTKVMKLLSDSTDLTVWDKLDKRLQETDKIFARVQKLKEKEASEETQGVTKGGASASLND